MGLFSRRKKRSQGEDPTTAPDAEAQHEAVGAPDPDDEPVQDEAPRG